MAEGHGGVDMFTSWQLESRKTDRKGSGHAPSDLLPLTRPSWTINEVSPLII
jgi:hypothetical protein